MENPGEYFFRVLLSNMFSQGQVGNYRVPYGGGGRKKLGPRTKARLMKEALEKRREGKAEEMKRAEVDRAHEEKRQRRQAEHAQNAAERERRAEAERQQKEADKTNPDKTPVPPKYYIYNTNQDAKIGVGENAKSPETVRIPQQSKIQILQRAARDNVKQGGAAPAPTAPSGNSSSGGGKSSSGGGGGGGKKK